MSTIVVGVLCHNVLSGLRFDLLGRTVASLFQAFPSAVIELHDNGSTDGTADLLMALKEQYEGKPLKVIVRTHGLDNTTPGAGRNHMMEWICKAYPEGLEPPPEVVVFSDDDIEWKPDIEGKLLQFWRYAPDEMAILCGYIEPVWHWNTPRRAIEHGAVRAVVRDSCPGGAWTFRFGSWPVIGPVKNDFGYDYDKCCKLREQGYEVAQADWATHIGTDASTHGNEAVDHVGTKPFDRKQWGLDDA
jgi:hypothetical protein